MRGKESDEREISTGQKNSNKIAHTFATLHGFSVTISAAASLRPIFHAFHTKSPHNMHASGPVLACALSFQIISTERVFSFPVVGVKSVDFFNVEKIPVPWSIWKEVLFVPNLLTWGVQLKVKGTTGKLLTGARLISMRKDFLFSQSRQQTRRREKTRLCLSLQSERESEGNKMNNFQAKIQQEFPNQRHLHKPRWDS